MHQVWSEMLSRSIKAHTLDALRRPVASTLPDGSQASVAYNALDQSPKP
jgi:hypothetical protein